MPGGSAGISVGIVLLFSDPIDSAVATGAAVAAAVVVSGCATVAAVIVFTDSATVVAADGAVVADVVEVANARKMLLKILFCVFTSSSSSASGNLCSPAIAAVFFVIAAAAAATTIDVAAAGEKKSFQLFFNLHLNSPTISSIVLSSATSFVSTLDFSSSPTFSFLLILHFPANFLSGFDCSVSLFVERRVCFPFC